MSKEMIALLGVSWLFLFVIIFPGSFLVVAYYKFAKKMSFWGSVVRGFAGWFYCFVILSIISVYNIMKYHPSFS